MALYSHRVPGSCEALLSTVLRVLEELGPSEVVLLSTVERDSCLELLEAVCKGLGAGLEVRWLGGAEQVEVLAGVEAERAARDEEYNLVLRASKVVEELLEEGFEVVAALGVAGRRLTAALALAPAYLMVKKRREAAKRVRVVHVEFLFGEWAGLPYPLTPRRLEPLALLYPLEAPAEEAVDRRWARLEWRVEVGGDGSCRVSVEGQELARLPPLRCAVAETCRRLNALVPGGVVVPGKSMSCGRLVVEVCGVRVEADVCSPTDVAMALSRVREACKILDEEAWSLLGLRPPIELGGALVDTSLVYRGAHLEAWAGASVAVPTCALAEVHKKLSEALKPPSPERLKWAREHVKSILAYLALRDLLSARSTRVYPAPGPDCDTAVPCMDPYLLQGLRLATVDSGAYHYWRASPAARVAEVLEWGELDRATRPASASQLLAYRDPGRVVARVYYALHQALAALALLDQLAEKGLVVPPQLAPGVRVEVEGEEVKPYAEPPLKALGL